MSMRYRGYKTYKTSRMHGVLWPYLTDSIDPISRIKFSKILAIVVYNHVDALLPSTTARFLYVLEQTKSSVVVRWRPSFGYSPLRVERTNARSGYFISGLTAESERR